MFRFPQSFLAIAVFKFQKTSQYGMIKFSVEGKGGGGKLKSIVRYLHRDSCGIRNYNIPHEVDMVRYFRRSPFEQILR